MCSTVTSPTSTTSAEGAAAHLGRRTGTICRRSLRSRRAPGKPEVRTNSSTGTLCGTRHGEESGQGVSSGTRHRLAREAAARRLSERIGHQAFMKTSLGSEERSQAVAHRRPRSNAPSTKILPQRRHQKRDRTNAIARSIWQRQRRAESIRAAAGGGAPCSRSTRMRANPNVRALQDHAFIDGQQIVVVRLSRRRRLARPKRRRRSSSRGTLPASRVAELGEPRRAATSPAPKPKSPGAGTIWSTTFRDPRAAAPQGHGGRPSWRPSNP